MDERRSSKILQEVSSRGGFDPRGTKQANIEGMSKELAAAGQLEVHSRTRL